MWVTEDSCADDFARGCVEVRRNLVATVAAQMRIEPREPVDHATSRLAVVDVVCTFDTMPEMGLEVSQFVGKGERTCQIQEWRKVKQKTRVRCFMKISDLRTGSICLDVLRSCCIHAWGGALPKRHVTGVLNGQI